MMEEPAGLETEFRSLTKHPAPPPKQWAYAYLAAFASVAGLKVVSFDSGFKGKARNLELLIL